jgi:predicted secreted hydrolase
LRFPPDAGAHLDYQTEWWYATGWLNTPSQEAAYGFQVTFFRSRVPQTQKLQSALAAKQLLFAHAAITDVSAQKLWHDQRIARWSGAPPDANNLDTAHADTTRTVVRIRNWSLEETPQGLQATIAADGFALNLLLVPSQAVLLQGDQGLSRKGPRPEQTSYYYSLPQLAVQGELTLGERRVPVAVGSTAWLDHEWSNHMLDPAAVGWDWIGINLLDGSALTAFQLRDATGKARWDGGSFRVGSRLSTFNRKDVVFEPLRWWTSPKSRARYPVEWLVRTPIATYRIKAMVDHQELDSRASTGAIYWEGLSEVFDGAAKLVGRGYLEMTGYASPMRL